MRFCEVPLRLVPNKIVRYPGGREIDRFRGIDPPLDDGRPEAWIGSDTPVAGAGPEDPYDGCARCVLHDGREVYLFEALAMDPEGMLGPEHLARSGPHMGLLVKLLDAQYQLGLQTHPTRAYAKAHFGSDYGKQESWYIIGLREDVPEPPYVLLGFKEGVTREDFARGYDAGDIAAMEACCHKVPVRVGDVFTIEAGAPHAVGPGCFLVEVQEPSDITVGARKLPEGTSPAEQAAHRERLLGCYRYEGADMAANLARYRVPPKTLRQGDWGREELLIGPEQTPYFSCTRLTASGPADLPPTGDIQVALVLQGRAKLTWPGGEMTLRKADELILPYAAPALRLIPEEPTALVRCNPAGVL